MKFTIERLVDGVLNELWKPVVTLEAETHEEALERFRKSDDPMREWDRVRVVRAKEKA